MNDKSKKQSIISRLDSICDKLDSTRLILKRCEYELSSNVVNGKTLDNGAIQSINSNILDLVNELKNKYEIEGNNRW